MPLSRRHQSGRTRALVVTQILFLLASLMAVPVLVIAQDASDAPEQATEASPPPDQGDPQAETP